MKESATTIEASPEHEVMVGMQGFLTATESRPRRPCDSLRRKMAQMNLLRQSSTDRKEEKNTSIPVILAWHWVKKNSFN